MRITSGRFSTATLVLGLLSLSMAAWAKDAVKGAVTPLGAPYPITTENGNPYSAGTYAVGTIQLFYTLNAYQFPAGTFASFQLDLWDLQINTNPPTPAYPVNLTLAQTGSSNLVLSPSTSSYWVTGAGWIGSSIVTISIPASVASDPSLNVDGTDLVGNLQLKTPQGSHLDTVTTIQVHIRLAHPTTCIRVYDFITDQAMTTSVTYTEVNTNKKSGKVTSTNPFGQLSDNILVVNTCASEMTFDLEIYLDSSFQTNPSGNPGNAVFTYFAAGYVDPTTFNISSFGAGTPQGQQLCLANITVPAGQTLLAAVHMAILSGMLASALPADGTFDFSSEVLTVGSTCGGAYHPLATPNPATVAVSFTTK